MHGITLQGDLKLQDDQYHLFQVFFISQAYLDLDDLDFLQDHIDKHYVVKADFYIVNVKQILKHELERNLVLFLIFQRGEHHH